MNKIGNFTLVSTKDIKEQNGTLYEYKHDNCGARLLFLKTDDRNKLFSVTFRTFPEDDTGVFHILEHSVLCGSKKYPVKDPFVELLKGSMNTFLNAMTFPDKTMYPVSSRNEKDFLNLADIYLDAVFNPNLYDNPNIFYQEGFHNELNSAEDDLKFNGVVLNEMKGAKSSVDTRLITELNRVMFKDNCYKYVSGGDPEAIPSLTYEQFVKTHERFYSPNNAIFYLEGDLDLNKPVELIEYYLKDVKESVQPTMEHQEAVEPVVVEVEYPIAKDEDEKNRTQILFGKIIGDFDEKEKIVGANVLASYLTSSLQAPLVEAILNSGLGQDVRLDIENGMSQAYVTIDISNTEADRLLDIKKTIIDLKNRIIAKGIDEKGLEADLNRLEFILKEPKEPRSLIHAMSVMNSYLYGGGPEMYLSYSETFNSLRDKIGTSFFTDLLDEILDVDKMTCIVAKPSKTLSDEEETLEKQKAAAIKDSMSKQEIDECLELNEKLRLWQATPDLPEAIATIPALSLSDVEDKPEEKKTIFEQIDDVKVLVHPAPISDLAYIKLYFPVPVKYQNDLPKLSLLANLLLNVPTSKHDVFDLNQDLKINTGNLSFEYIVADRNDDIDNANVYFTVHCSLLKSKAKEGLKLVREVLLESKLDAKEMVSNVLHPLFEGFRSDIIEAGHSLGMRRALASSSSRNGATEMLEGLMCYQEVKKIVENMDEELDPFVNFLVDASKEIFTSDKMIVGITLPHGESKDEYGLSEFIRSFVKGGKEIDMKISLPKGNTYVEIPSGIAYSACGTNLKLIGDHYQGAHSVLSNVVSLEYLWSEIRVKGGAYGTGLSIAMSSSAAFYSYRDPNPIRSFATYKDFVKFLREYCSSDENIEKYIISTIAGMEPLLTPANVGRNADREYLCGVDYEANCVQRKQILNTTKQDLLNLCDLLENFYQTADKCLIGPKMDGFKADVIIKL